MWRTNPNRIKQLPGQIYTGAIWLVVAASALAVAWEGRAAPSAEQTYAFQQSQYPQTHETRGVSWNPNTPILKVKSAGTTLLAPEPRAEFSSAASSVGWSSTIFSPAQDTDSLATAQSMMERLVRAIVPSSNAKGRGTSSIVTSRWRLKVKLGSAPESEARFSKRWLIASPI